MSPRMVVGLAIIALLFFIIPGASAKPFALEISLKGPIGPATADYVRRSLKEAKKESAALLIVEIDTPGGLSDSMREIVQDILSSPIPIITYVAPGGARAASAGTYIVYASHIATMAPGTNLGASTPVDLAQNKGKESSKEQLKAINDAKAYIRSLAELRQRNVLWAEQSVSQALSLSADEALRMNVINIIALNEQDLLNKINGKVVEIRGKNIVIQSQSLPIRKIMPDWRTHFLAAITNPSLAYGLLILGVCALFFELMNPGFILPGVIGGMALIIGLYALELLPINSTGLLLILIGLGCMIGEVVISAFGGLGIAGVVAFLIGSVMLMKPDTGLHLPVSLIVLMTVLMAAFFSLLVFFAVRARRRKSMAGKEAMIGQEGVVVIEKNCIWVHIGGERWQVVEGQPLKNGQKVKIVGVEGLKLKVEPC